MSYAILELDLREPAASLERVVTPAGDVMWRARCERCGGHSRPYHLISNVMHAHERHADDHVSRDEKELTDMLSSTRRPVEVLAVA